MFSSSDDSIAQEKTFAPMIIRILLDQSSAVASLGQQALVSVVTELRRLSDEKNGLFQQVIHSEIFKGVIEGLMMIVDGKKKTPRAEDEDDTEEHKKHRVFSDGERRRSSVTPGFEASLNIHHQGVEDDFDQGEISLAKITCISVKSSLTCAYP